MKFGKAGVSIGPPPPLPHEAVSINLHRDRWKIDRFILLQFLINVNTEHPTSCDIQHNF
jgi:hypothetical protein